MMIGAAGIHFDKDQGIFYSTMDPWQKKFGYCRFYDSAAPLSGMVFDCEPVRFEYEGKDGSLNCGRASTA
jgi:hypothetical protein